MAHLERKRWRTLRGPRLSVGQNRRMLVSAVVLSLLAGAPSPARTASMDGR